jgi:Leucine-rich repeat (LRR) protein
MGDILDALLTTPNVSPVSFLNLFGNALTYVPPQLSRFTHLNEVSLAHNNITFLQSGAFEFTPPLQWLFLQSNQITKIEEGAFKGLKQLIATSSSI